MPESLALEPQPLAASRSVATRSATAAIAGVGAALPDRVVSNGEVAAELDVSEEWILERTGVRERRRVGGPAELLDLAAAASLRALAEAQASPSDVDLVLAATMTHEWLTPNLAPLLAAEIGAERVGALDVGAACTGFLGALALATGQVESGRAAAVLVIGADQMSRIVDSGDRSTGALFGDGAGAVLVTGAGPGRGRLGPVVLGHDGGRGELVQAERAEAILRMEGQDTFREAVRRLCAATEDALSVADLELDDVDAFIYHQANARILRSVGQRLGIPPERVVECISRYGNTSAASVPIALDEALASGRLRPAGRALLAAFGGGLTWGATVVDWGEADAA